MSVNSTYQQAAKFCFDNGVVLQSEWLFTIIDSGNGTPQIGNWSVEDLDPPAEVDLDDPVTAQDWWDDNEPYAHSMAYVGHAVAASMFYVGVDTRIKAFNASNDNMSPVTNYPDLVFRYVPNCHTLGPLTGLPMTFVQPSYGAGWYPANIILNQNNSENLSQISLNGTLQLTSLTNNMTYMSINGTMMPLTLDGATFADGTLTITGGGGGVSDPLNVGNLSVLHNGSIGNMTFTDTTSTGSAAFASNYGGKYLVFTGGDAAAGGLIWADSGVIINVSGGLCGLGTGAGVAFAFDPATRIVYVGDGSSGGIIMRDGAGLKLSSNATLTPSEGTIAWNYTSHNFVVYDGSQWATSGGGGSAYITSGVTGTDVVDSYVLVSSSGTVSGLDLATVVISTFVNDAAYIDDTYDDSDGDFFGGETSLSNAVKRIANMLGGGVGGIT